MDIPTDKTEQQELLTELAYSGVLTPVTYQRAVVDALKRVIEEWQPQMLRGYPDRPIAGLKAMELHARGGNVAEERGLGYDHP